MRASPGTLSQFQNTLKTILLCSAYGTWFGTFVTVQTIRTAWCNFTYFFTYLKQCRRWVAVIRDEFECFLMSCFFLWIRNLFILMCAVAPPPTYDSLFGQVKAARAESSSTMDFFKKFLTILLGTRKCLYEKSCPKPHGPIAKLTLRDHGFRPMHHMASLVLLALTHGGMARLSWPRWLVIYTKAV